MLFLDALAADGGYAKGVSDYLWTFYQERSVGVGSGISAFPSLHVAIAMLNALFVHELFGRLGRFLAWSYLAFTMFGSVYLGWHYAVDGYASIVLVIIIYWLGRKLIPNCDEQDSSQFVVRSIATQAFLAVALARRRACQPAMSFTQCRLVLEQIALLSNAQDQPLPVPA